MRTKRKAIDLVAYKDGQRIAFEIETGKNSRKQIKRNVEKCLEDGVDKVYLVGTNGEACEKILKFTWESL